MRSSWPQQTGWNGVFCMNEQDLKAAMRREVRAGCPGPEQIREESAAICGHLMRWRIYRSARCVALYMPLRREADIGPLALDALASGKRVFLPLVEGSGMSFRQIRSMEETRPGAFGIREPRRDAPEAQVEGIDLMLLPLEAADRTGRRLGKGGGYYDRILRGARPAVACGIALSHQLVSEVPANAWDQPLDCLCGPDGILLCGAPARDRQSPAE